METIRNIEDFKKFLKDNKELVKANTIDIKDLPKDDAWVQDDKWDEIYKGIITWHERKKTNGRTVTTKSSAW